MPLLKFTGVYVGYSAYAPSPLSPVPNKPGRCNTSFSMRCVHRKGAVPGSLGPQRIPCPAALGGGRCPPGGRPSLEKWKRGGVKMFKKLKAKNEAAICGGTTISEKWTPGTLGLSEFLKHENDKQSSRVWGNQFSTTSGLWAVRNKKQSWPRVGDNHS
jgi:hypothetical protein